MANPTPSTSDTHNRIVRVEMPVIRGRSLSPKALSKRSRSTSPESDKDNKMRRLNSYHDKVKTSLPLSSASHDGSQDLDTSSDEDDENKGNIPPGTHDGLHTATPTSGSKRKVSFQAPFNPPKLRRHDDAHDLEAVMYDPFLESVESCKRWGIEKGYLLGADHDQSTIDGVIKMCDNLVYNLTAKRRDIRGEMALQVSIGNIHINAIKSCPQMKESCKISAGIRRLNRLKYSLVKDDKFLQKNIK